MPLTNKGEKILSGMEKEYGAKKGEEVFYASRNKGTISGVDAFNKVADMTSDDWKELRDKLAKFFKEEAREPEHKEDAAPKGYAAARSELAALGVELKWNDEWEEFTVKKKGTSGTGYHTDDLQDAISTGRTMAKKADDVPAKLDAILKRMDAYNTYRVLFEREGEDRKAEKGLSKEEAFEIFERLKNDKRYNFAQVIGPGQWGRVPGKHFSRGK
jgi:hypothetical protein